MTKAQHTPGHWKIWNSGYTGCPDVIYVGNVEPKLGGEHGSKLICATGSYIAEASTSHMHLNKREDIVQHENGRLIAAAPCLLKHLEEVTQALKDVVGAAGGGDAYSAVELEELFAALVCDAENAIAKATGAA